MFMVAEQVRVIALYQPNAEAVAGNLTGGCVYGVARRIRPTTALRFG